MTRRSSLVLILGVALQLMPVSAQNSITQPPLAPQPQLASQDDEDVVRITTNLIQMDAVVTDKNGMLVTDLSADDFEVQENGEVQKITNFSFVPITPVPNNPVAPNPSDKNAVLLPPIHLRAEQVRRTIALVIDDLSLSFQSTYYARRALKKFVDEQMQPGDLVAVIRTGGGMGALQQFTSDKRQLYAAIERIRWNQLGRGGVSAFAPMTGGDIQSETMADLPGRSNDNGVTSDDLNEFRNEIFAIGTLGALDFIIRGLREMPGRKSVMLVSDGLKIFNREGQSDRVLGSLRRLTDRANRASVVIYTLDARGLQTLGLTAEDSTQGLASRQIESMLLNRRTDFFESQNGLDYLAQETGGIATRNNNDLSGGIKKMLNDQQGYYLIGYQPNADTFDPKRARFNKLVIKVKRRGLKIRYRSGFFGITDEESLPAVPRTRAEQLARAVTVPFSSGAVGVQLTSLFANDAKSGSFMRSLLHVDVDKLTFTEDADGWHKLVFDIMAVTFGDNGVVVDQVSRTENMRVRGETYQRVMKYGFDYILTVPVKKAGAYQLRAALRDTVTERVGSASQFIEVPDINKNRLVLSGLIVSGFDPQKLKKNPGTGDASEPPVVPEPEAVPGVRRLRSGLVMEFAYVIYNAKLDNITRRPQLQTQVRLFREGKEVFAGNVLPFDPGTQTDLKRLNAGGRVQLSTEMVPGEYVLQVIVTDLHAKEKQRTSTQWIDFQISDK